MGAIGGIGFVLALIFMVMFHEFGHYVTAKHYGMKVTQFFFGFGPKLWSVRPKVRVGADGATAPSETEYGVKAIPAGGYVKIVGMNPLEEVSPQEEPRTFRGKPASQKLVVLVAGSATHFLTGLVLLLLVFSVFGQPGASIPVIRQVIHRPGNPLPAETAGFQAGDRIVSVDGMPISSWGQLSAYISAHPGKDVDFGVVRQGQRVDLRTTLTTNEQGKGFLGFQPDYEIIRDSLPVGLWHSAQAFWDTAYFGIKGLVGFFSPSHLSRYLSLLSGGQKQGETPDPNRFVSVVGAVQIGSQLGDISDYLKLLAAVVIFVGVVNLLPLFPLDGGWVAVTLYEQVASRVRRRKVSADFRRLVPVTYAVLFVFGFLFLTSLYLDITSPIKLNL